MGDDVKTSEYALVCNLKAEGNLSRNICNIDCKSTSTKEERQSNPEQKSISRSPAGLCNHPEEDDLVDPAEVASASASSRSPRSENQKPKKRRSSSAEGKNKKVRKAAPEPAATTVVLVAIPGTMRPSTRLLPPSVSEQPTNNTASTAAASQPKTPSASSLSRLVVPSSPSTATSSPPAAEA
ncbi:PREDICTED: putative protein TPRXL [Nicotiana attenuata]|uniref:putative protein TPRXL n=1 Tax=Nicotiana attenuata TaxID=49451 RepID=UPI0009050C93|nr:PREDICTED: putative protein TPRXL [Nicotiana attenuata]